jgi:hypothetical protein
MFEPHVADTQLVSSTCSVKENTMLQLSSSVDRRTRGPATAIVRGEEGEVVVLAARERVGNCAVRHRGADPITIGMLAGGLLLGALGVAVAASYSYAHAAGMVISLIWWGIYFGALGASIGALPGLFTQRARGNREIGTAAAPCLPHGLHPCVRHPSKRV